MAKKGEKDSEMTPAQNIGVGVGLTTAVVAAAGAYFLYGSKSAAKNRKVVKSWALKAKAEVLEKLEDSKEMTQEEFREMVTGVVGTYAAVKNASKNEVKAFKDEMMDSWKAIEKTTKPKKKVAAKKAVSKKVVVKKAAK